MAEGPPVGSPVDSIATGIAGLDDVLEGGLVADRLYLIEGTPGSGKTTLALQFLIEGARRGEPVLYLTLSETEEELRAVAISHGWTLDGVTVCEVLPGEAVLDPSGEYTMFHPSEVELGQTIQTILRDVQRVKPIRAVIDSLSELRLLAASPLRFRRQILALKHFLAGRGCTFLLLDDLTAPDGDLQIRSLVHGEVLLQQLSPEYGRDRRRLRVVKLRGRQYRDGYHDYAIQRGGLDVFPRLVLTEQRVATAAEPIATGIPKLDRLLGGGIERGTSTLIVGAPGTGKSTLAMQLASTLAGRGEHAALFLFDEGAQTLLRRAAGLGIDLRSHVDAGRVVLQSIDPAELSPGEFAKTIQRAVEVRHARIVVIDSLNGYLAAMPAERFLTIQLRELLTYLAQRRVVTVLVGAHQGLIGTQMSAPVDASYLADTVVLMRYFEARGEVRQAISIVKKRDGRHERTIREFRIDAGGIDVGEPLRKFRGVLTGVPAFEPDDASARAGEVRP